MNKKFSTLLTMGLLIAGSLFSMANAQAPTGLTLPIGDPAGSVKSGQKYFVIQQASSSLAASDLVLGFAKDATTPATKVADASTVLTESSAAWVTTATTATVNANLEVNSYIWTVAESKVGSGAGAKYYYTFTNASTGKVLTIKGAVDAEALVTDYAASVSGYTTSFIFGSNSTAPVYAGGGTVLTYESASAANKGFLLAETSTTFGTGGNFYLYEVAPTPVEASDLNDAANGSFTLKYDKSTNNPFAGAVKAFKLNSLSGSGVADGTYFATSWPKSLDDADAITTLANFKSCTFIAADPKSNYKINDLNIAGGEGYGFANVKGSMLLTTPDVTNMKKGYIKSNNAAFTVTQEYGNTEDYKLALNNTLFLSKDQKATVSVAGELIIAALSDQQGKYVTTVLESNGNFDDYTSTCTIDAANLMTVDKLLSGNKASVFNIKFLSTTAKAGDKTESEYNKYLGVNDATEVFFAQGSDFVNLDAPENQWIIIAADKDNNHFVFQNRDLADQTLEVQLVKTGKDNVYEVLDFTDVDGSTPGVQPAKFNYAWVADKKYTVSASATNLGGTTIELTPVTVDPKAGFVTDQLDDAGLINFVVTSANKIAAEKLYLGAGATASAAFEVHKELSAANQWSVVKSNVDPYEAYNDYVYYDAGDKEVKTKLNGDTIAVSSYSFKMYGADNTYLGVTATNLTPETQVDVEDAQQFLVKANKNGTYSLIEVAAGNTDYRDIVADNTAKTFSVDETSAKVDNDANGNSAFYDYTAEYVLSIEKEVLTPSLKHEPNYVTFNASDKGYVAMDSTLFEGIVAPVSMLRAAYTADELTFRLDTADTNAYVPAFYISHIGKFMYNAKDSADYYNDGTASAEGNKNYKLEDKESAKALFRAATLVASDTLATTVNGKEVAVTVNKTKTTLGGLNNFKYQIVQRTKDSEGEYVIKSVNDRLYLFNLNGHLGFTADPAKALVVYVEQSQSPVANEAVTTSSIKVIAGNGVVTVMGAQGKKVAISNVLGQTIANTVVTSSEATIAAPAGVVVVAVEGEAAVKAIVK